MPALPPRPAPPADPALQRIDRLGYLLDNALRVPGTSFRFGYDALLGLIPGLGDLTGLLLSGYIILEATRYRLPFATLLRMAINVAVETLVGTVPLLGDLFDATWKANTRNLDLLRRHLAGRPAGHRPSDRRFYLSVALVLLFLVALLVFALVLAWRGLAALLG